MSEKWIAIVGSPRRGKNTDRLTDFVIEALNNRDIRVKKYYLDRDNILACNACEYCIKEGVCNVKDGLTEILDEMKSADGYILAAPSYNYNVSAQMKILMDRTFCLNDYSHKGWRSRLEHGKKAVIIGICKGKGRDAMGYTIEAMRKPIDELDVKVVEIIEYFNTKYEPVINNKEIKEEVINRIMNNREL